MTDAPYKVGDKVTRPINAYETGSPIRSGYVTRCYDDRPDYPELYEVTWVTENGKPIEPIVCVGYLRHGLTRQEQA